MLTINMEQHNKFHPIFEVAMLTGYKIMKKAALKAVTLLVIPSRASSLLHGQYP